MLLGKISKYSLLMDTPQSASAQQKPVIKLANSKFNTIQSFRFIAAFMVLILHNILYTSERLVDAGYNYEPGNNGVDLFFTISGFVMIWASQKLIGRPDGWKEFGWKRILRVVPIYWLITTFKLLVMLKSPEVALHSKIDVVFILKSYFFIPAKNPDSMFMPFYGVGWTLNFEMFFYLMFAIALALKIKPLPFLACIFIPLGALSFFVTPQWPDALAFYANIRVLNFLYGLIAATLILNNKLISGKFAAAFIVVGLLAITIPHLYGGVSIPQFNFIAVGIATFLIVYGGACIEPYIGSKIPGWLIYWGTASYSLYLIHPTASPVGPTIMKKLNIIQPIPSIVLGMSISLIAAVIFYNFCEKPLTKLLSKLTADKKHIAVPAT